MNVILRKYLRTILMAVLCLLLIEALLRWGFGLGSPPLMQKDEDIGYLFQPNQELRRFGHRIRINSYSQRSEAVTPLPGPRVLRILALGDSVTWGGVQVDQTQTFPSQLQSLLEDSLQKPVEVLNASAASWGIGNQTAYLRRFGTLGARLVIWQIGTEDLYQPKSRGNAVGISPFLPDRQPYCAISELFSRYIMAVFMDVSTIPGYQVFQYSDVAFEENLTVFQAMVKELRGQEIEVMVLYTPFLDEVWPSEPTPAHLPSAALARFVNLCASLQVPVLNLGVIWKNQPAAIKWFRDPLHLSADGNRAAAEELERFLRLTVLEPEETAGEHP